MAAQIARGGLGVLPGAGAVPVLGRVAEAWRAWRLYRRTRAELEGLTDRELADIGLQRAEIDRVAHGGQVAR